MPPRFRYPSKGDVGLCGASHFEIGRYWDSEEPNSVENLDE
jgi:hypothetical protein